MAGFGQGDPSDSPSTNGSGSLRGVNSVELYEISYSDDDLSEVSLPQSPQLQKSIHPITQSSIQNPMTDSPNIRRISRRYVIVKPEAYSTEPFIQPGQRPGFYRPENRQNKAGIYNENMNERPDRIQPIDKINTAAMPPVPPLRTREDDIEERVRNEYWPIFSAIRLTARLLKDKPAHVSEAGLPFLRGLLEVVGTEHNNLWLDGIVPNTSSFPAS